VTVRSECLEVHGECRVVYRVIDDEPANTNVTSLTVAGEDYMMCRYA